MMVRLDYHELKDVIIEELGGMHYNFEEYFEEWESKTLASSGTVSPDEFERWENYHNFDWRTEDGNTLNVKIALIYDAEADEDYYVLKHV